MSSHVQFWRGQISNNVKAKSAHGQNDEMGVKLWQGSQEIAAQLT